MVYGLNGLLRTTKYEHKNVVDSITGGNVKRMRWVKLREIYGNIIYMGST